MSVAQLASRARHVRLALVGRRANLLIRQGCQLRSTVTAGWQDALVQSACVAQRLDVLRGRTSHARNLVASASILLRELLSARNLASRVRGRLLRGEAGLGFADDAASPSLHSLSRRVRLFSLLGDKIVDVALTQVAARFMIRGGGGIQPGWVHHAWLAEDRLLQVSDMTVGVNDEGLAQVAVRAQVREHLVRVFAADDIKVSSTLVDPHYAGTLVLLPHHLNRPLS